MNPSLWQSGRDTHVKIVVMSLVASITVLAVVASAHFPANDRVTMRAQPASVVAKAGGPTVDSDSGRTTIR